jgi:hypothetical protein
MTNKKVLLTIKKIEKSKTEGLFIEALLKVYYANVSLLVSIVNHCDPMQDVLNKKPKAVLKEFLKIYLVDETIKGIIAKKSVKHLKDWFKKMETFFDKIRIQQPKNTKQLLQEAEYLLNILNISNQKIIGNKETKIAS